jgi:hypothetical protein
VKINFNSPVDSLLRYSSPHLSEEKDFVVLASVCVCVCVYVCVCFCVCVCVCV